MFGRCACLFAYGMKGSYIVWLMFTCFSALKTVAQSLRGHFPRRVGLRFRGSVKRESLAAKGSGSRA